MDNIQNASLSKELTKQLEWEGLILGGKAGLLASALYTAVGLFVIEILGQGFFSSPIEPRAFGLILIFLTMILCFVILPATIIGALTGLYLGQLAKLLWQHMSRYLFVLLCASSCVVIVILFHMLFEIPIELSFQSSPGPFYFGVYGTYPFAIGIPSVIYVLMGIWVAWKLYSEAGMEKEV